MNTHVPALVAETFRASRIVAFSTGNVYPLTPLGRPGASEATVPAPVGEYAQSCLGRERMFEHFSQQHGTPGRLFRLNYAIDMRYGVLVDIAAQGPARRAGRRHDGPRQRDLAGRRERAGRCAACATARRRRRRSTCTGPETLSVRALAEALGARMGVQPQITGSEAPTALLSDTTLASSPVRLSAGAGRAACSTGSPTGSRAAARASASRPSSRSAMASSDVVASTRSARGDAGGGAGAVGRGRLEPDADDWRALPRAGPCDRRAATTPAGSSPPPLRCPTTAAPAGSRWCWSTPAWRHRGLASRLLGECIAPAAGAAAARRRSTRPPPARRLRPARLRAAASPSSAGEARAAAGERRGAAACAPPTSTTSARSPRWIAVARRRRPRGAAARLPRPPPHAGLDRHARSGFVLLARGPPRDAGRPARRRRRRRRGRLLGAGAGARAGPRLHRRSATRRGRHRGGSADAASRAQRPFVRMALGADAGRPSRTPACSPSPARSSDDDPPAMLTSTRARAPLRKARRSRRIRWRSTPRAGSTRAGSGR